MCDQQERIVVVNKHNEKLVGLLHDTGSNQIVVLCHGFQSTKYDDLRCHFGNWIKPYGSLSRIIFEQQLDFKGANHGFSKHQDELISVVLSFIKEPLSHNQDHTS